MLMGREHLVVAMMLVPVIFICSNRLVVEQASCLVWLAICEQR